MKMLIEFIQLMALIISYY